MPVLSLAVEAHECDRCRVQGVQTEILVRMLPRPVIMMGELIDDEWWGCPVCLKPHYPVKKALQRSVVEGKRRKRAVLDATRRSTGRTRVDRT